jgi:hypothetical protein
LLNPGGEGGVAGGRIDPGAASSVGFQVAGVVVGGGFVGEAGDGGVAAGGAVVADASGVGAGVFDPGHDSFSLDRDGCCPGDALDGRRAQVDQ